MFCKDCKFKVGDDCRRYPPNFTQRIESPRIGGTITVSRFPVTEDNEWCGEFKPIK